MTSINLLNQLTLDEKISLLSGESVWGLDGIDRVGLEPIRMMDGPVGLRSTPVEQGGTVGPSTNFPAVVCMAASLRPDLVEEVGRALGREARAKGFHILLAPCINLHRVPIGGRNFESFSEDPHWTLAMSIPYIDGVQSEGIGVSLKHFAVNNQEFQRLSISAEVDKRTLRELYLSMFEAVVKATQPWTVMASYNRVNGVHACENRELLTDILRRDWGYEGVVVSDWGAVHSGAETVKAGCNIEMPGPGKFLNHGLKDAIADGALDESDIDALVLPILGLYRKCQEAVGGNQANTPEHQALSRQVAEEGMVLLKNDRAVLPFDLEAFRKGRKKLAVLGPLANQPVLGGGGSSLVDPPYHITALQGIREALGEDVEVLYEPGCTIFSAEKPLDSSHFSCQIDGETRPGFAVEYYDNPDCDGTPLFIDHETDMKAHYYFSNTSPREGVPDHGYSIRWRATYTPDASGAHHFMLTNDEKAKLFIGGREVVSNWGNPQINIPIKGKIELNGGQSHSFELSFAKTRGYGGLRLVSSTPQEEAVPARAVALAEAADAVILFAGLNDKYEHEGNDRESFSLPDGQDELIQTVAAANPDTVVALYNGSAVDMSLWVDQVAGILECWYPGMENGRAVANLLFGKVNPSGKLPSTFPKRFEDSSCAADYPGANGKIHYSEGVFVGHRHFEKHKIEPLFPLGHGLGYTDFAYGGLTVVPGDGPNATVRFVLTNTGTVAGAEGVQLYLRDCEASLPRPEQELKGLKKVELQPGESREVSFTLGEEAFRFWDVGTDAWTWEPGDFEVRIGASSADIRLNAVFALQERY